MKALNVVNEEITLGIAKDGVSIRQMDIAHIYMVDFNLPAQAFIEYDVETEGRITVNVATLRRILKRAGDEDNVHLGIEGAKLVVSSPDRTFKLSTYENTELNPIPKVDLKTHAKAKSLAFFEALDDLAIAETQYIEVVVKDKDIRVRAKGDAVQCDIAMSKGALDTFMEEEVSSGYSLDILKPIAKASKSLADDFVMDFDKDMPIRMSWKPYKNADMTFYVAPRIEG